MADNEWMYSGHKGPNGPTDEWAAKTDVFLKKAFRSSKRISPQCPCAKCQQRHRRTMPKMSKHLCKYGYMPNFTMSVNTRSRTHAQGNRSHHHHKKNLELVMKQPVSDVSDVQAWKLGRVHKTPKEGKGPYYATDEEHLKAYEDDFHQRNGEVPDPILSETDETMVVLPGHSKPHDRHAILNSVIQPTFNLTQLRSSSTSASTANPSRAWPRISKEGEAYHSYLHSYRQELDAHDAKVRVLEEYRDIQMENMYAALQNGTRAPPMGPPPPNPGPYPKMLSIEEFLARDTQTPGSDESNIAAGGSSTPGGATPSSRSPITPTNNLGGGASTSTRDSPLL